jgi:hypothetical protein
MLFDPLKEKLDLPTAPIQHRFSKRCYHEIVGEKRAPSILSLIEKFDPTKLIRAAGLGKHSGEDNHSITS